MIQFWATKAGTAAQLDERRAFEVSLEASARSIRHKKQICPEPYTFNQSVAQSLSAGKVKQIVRLQIHVTQ